MKDQQIAAQGSPKTTKIYDRMADEITLDGAIRIIILDLPADLAKVELQTLA